MKSSINIRFAKSSDIKDIVDLCELHAIYEKAEYNKEGKAEQLNIDLFSENQKLFCLVVESHSILIGYATYMKQYSTWDANEYIYMDCLFIKESYRGKGLGEKLIQRIQKEGKKIECDLIQWQTPDFNTRAVKFYKRVGAISKPKERFFLQI